MMVAHIRLEFSWASGTKPPTNLFIRRLTEHLIAEAHRLKWFRRLEADDFVGDTTQSDAGLARSNRHRDDDPPLTGYAPTRDGQRFLVNAPAGGEGAAAPPITVALNWTAGLKK